MIIKVDCCAGYRGEETPRQGRISRRQRVAIVKVS